MRDLRQLAHETVEAFKARAAGLSRAHRYAVLGMVALGSGVAGACQFLNFPATGATPSQAIGIAGSVVVAVGGIWAAIADRDVGTSLALAAEAVEAGRLAQAGSVELERVQVDNDVFWELLQALDAMRESIEGYLASDGLTQEELISRLLLASERSLRIALRFEQADRWSIAIYKAEPSEDDPSRMWLRLIETKRAIECDKSKSRKWLEGVGIAGVTYTNMSDFVIPDVTAPGARELWANSNVTPKPEDQEVYRSIASSPIRVRGMARPFGVVVATNDVVGHFRSDDFSVPRPDEIVKALAGMLSLAISAHSRTTRVAPGSAPEG